MEDGYALPSRTMRNANVQYIGGATLIVVYNVSPFSTMLSDLESSAIIADFFLVHRLFAEFREGLVTRDAFSVCLLELGV